MLKKNIYKHAALAAVCLVYTACKVPALVQKTENSNTPAGYNNQQATTDSTNTAQVKWREFFTDANLVTLIDSALKNNQELSIRLQELQVAQNEILARKGEYLPFVGYRGAAGVDKVARYTNIGALEKNIDIKPGKEMPEPLPDFLGGLYARWEVDIWHKLRNARKAAVSRYLATVEGRNFIVTQLIAEIANSYYELLALDNQLDIVNQNIALQSNALEIVRLQKEATRVTELAVRKFEAEVLKTQSLQYDIKQQITETENRINFLMGRFPQHINRTATKLNDMLPASVYAGIPSQLLVNRPDIRQAELELQASKLDVQVARAQFFPSLGLSASAGYQAFSPAYLFKTPESILYSLAGDLTGPLVNRNAIKSVYGSANAKQTQAVYNYERTILNAYVEVANQLANIHNLDSTYITQNKQVQALTQSIDLANELFKSTRADYLEVLMTQRDALEARLELIETRKQQMNAVVNIYQALGGGWN